MNGLVTQSDWTELIEGFTLVNKKSALFAIVFELEVVFTIVFFPQTLLKDTSDFLFVEPIVTNILTIFICFWRFSFHLLAAGNI